MLTFKRFLAGYIDHMLISVIILLPLAAAFGFKFMNDNLIFVSTGGTILYAFKDVFNKSVGKKILKLKVIDGDGKKSTVWKRILRNLTMPIWPVEVLIMLVRKDHLRLMDLLLDTNVVEE